MKEAGCDLSPSSPSPAPRGLLSLVKIFAKVQRWKRPPFPQACIRNALLYPKTQIPLGLGCVISTTEKPSWQKKKKKKPRPLPVAQEGNFSCLLELFSDWSVITYTFAQREGRVCVCVCGVSILWLALQGPCVFIHCNTGS